MTTQLFPARREDGSAEVAAVFHRSLDESRTAIEQALQEWRTELESVGVDILADLVTEPQVTASDEGFRVVFRIRAGSWLWKDWAVSLVGSLSSRLGPDSFIGFFDGVQDRMHPASRFHLLDDGGGAQATRHRAEP